MDDDIDRLFADGAHVPPEHFAARVEALARTIPQQDARTQTVNVWQWATLGLGAGVGAFLFGQFALFAFVSVAAH